MGGFVAQLVCKTRLGLARYVCETSRCLVSQNSEVKCSHGTKLCEARKMAKARSSTRALDECSAEHLSGVQNIRFSSMQNIRLPSRAEHSRVTAPRCTYLLELALVHYLPACRKPKSVSFYPSCTISSARSSSDPLIALSCGHRSRNAKSKWDKVYLLY